MISNRKFAKFIKISLLPVVLSLFFLLPGKTSADDTEIYSYGSSLKPMVLIILDNSGSMRDKPSSSSSTTATYDSSTTYDGSYVSSTWYKITYVCKDWRGNTVSCSSWSARTKETVYVATTLTVTDTNGDGQYYASGISYVLGNYLNYYEKKTATKITIARNVVKSIINSMSDQIDFGLMDFNYQDGGNLLASVGTDSETLISTVSGITASTWTPLAETLATAGKYFAGAYNTSTVSPWTSANWCQKGYVILVTDGMPTYDTDKDIIGYFLDRDANGNLQTGITDTNRGQKWDKTVPADYNSATGNDVWVKDDAYGEETPQTFLDDVAKYLYSHDMRPTIEGNQNITTYTIGFDIDNVLLQQTATEGGGQYFTASDYTELQNSLLKALSDITSKFQTYTAPVVPVTRASSGDKMYLAFFKPMANQGFWPGDLQKYALSDTNKIMNSDGVTEATNEDGSMKESAVPFWSVNSVLKARTSARNIYTYLGSNNDLTDSSNAFTTDNSAMISQLGTLTPMAGSESGKSSAYSLIRYLHGYDAYYETGNYSNKRDKILGDVLHSVPLVVDYGASYTEANRYIFFGSNDGMVHCINDADGSEVWAFIPPDQLPKLKYIVEGTAHKYFVDSSVKLYQERDKTTGAITKAIIIFGERAGGENYYALDVTTPNKPIFLWNINSSTTGYGELGQTWSEPVIGTVRWKNASNVEQDYQAVVFSAGFDGDQSGHEAVAASAKGRGVFIANVLTGELLKSFVYTSTNGMDYSIPSSVLAVDQSFDGKIDRIYVGDLGGNLWRIAAEDGKDNLVNSWSLRKLFSSGGGRKIFYPPDITFLNGYDYLYFGTGDRDNPRPKNATVVVNRIYGVKDTNPSNANFITLTESYLTDQTTAVFSTDSLSTSGWYVRLTNTGEGVLAPVVLFNKYVLTTTFIPNSSTCSVGGDARLYASYYLNGASTYYNLGTGIPTEVVLVVRAGGATAFVGVGAGVKNVRDLTPASGQTNSTTMSEIFDIKLGVIPISWREVFDDE